MRHTGRCRGPMRSLLSTLRTNAPPPGSLAPQLQMGRISAAASRLLRTTAGHTCTEARSRAASARPQSPSCRSYAGSSSSSPSPLQMQPQTKRRAPVECGVVSPRRTVPDHIPKTPYYATGAVPPQDNIVSHFGWYMKLNTYLQCRAEAKHLFSFRS